ncbi:MAG: ribonuclease R [Peptostreptococcaceae bacterium]|nr:ribonuclease R [Peptostreptococcaceae bacterium]
MGNIKDHILHLMKEESYRPLGRDELIKVFSSNRSERTIIGNILDQMQEEGLIYRTKKEKYGIPEKMNLHVGRLTIHPKGFGFLETENEEEDIFIPAHAVSGAMNGDKVIVRKLRSEKTLSKFEGEVIKIIERVISSVVGTYESSKNFGFVIPEDRKLIEDVFISKKFAGKAKTGDVVVCKIIEYPKKGRNAEGKITEILGRKGDPKIGTLSVIRQKKLSEMFPKKVLSEAERISAEITEKELQRRTDLRNELIYTIDGWDSKDFDDAISIKKTEEGNYQLGVHIADVAHYVKEGGVLDEEAKKRGTSVYLVDQVLPMLPEALSNEICSLQPKEERLTLSCLMEVDQRGNVIRHEIRESVISSKARLVYDQVSDFLEHDEVSDSISDFQIQKNLRICQELASILRDKRKKRGSVDFDFPESKIVTNSEGKVLCVEKEERRTANRMIEEFMILANETVAEQFFWSESPFIYRTHDTPDAERMSEFMRFIAGFGYHLKDRSDDMHPKELQKLLQEIKGKQEAAVIAKLMLRSLRQARYSPVCSGHFGLASKYYCHFTSPIRRYPDLQIHRIVKESLANPLSSDRAEHFRKVVEEVAYQSSVSEREADEAQRQVEDLKKAEYMMEFVGQIYEATISSLTSFGIFVMLENTVEGLIRLHELTDDYYSFDPVNYQMVGEHTKRKFLMGDRLKVRLESVSLELREINFSLA